MKLTAVFITFAVAMNSVLAAPVSDSVVARELDPTGNSPSSEPVSGTKTELSTSPSETTRAQKTGYSSDPTPTSGANSDSTKVPEDGTASSGTCEEAGKHYTVSVTFLQKHLDDAMARWKDTIPETKWEYLTQASATTKAIYDKTTSHVDNGLAVNPKLSEQQDVVAKLDGLTQDIEKAKPSWWPCHFPGCKEFDDAADAVKGIKVAIDSLSKACSGPSQSTDEPSGDSTIKTSETPSPTPTSPESTESPTESPTASPTESPTASPTESPKPTTPEPTETPSPTSASSETKEAKSARGKKKASKSTETSQSPEPTEVSEPSRSKEASQSSDSSKGE